MCLTLNGDIYAFAGDTVVCGALTGVRVLRHGKEITRFEIDVPIQWIKVSPHGDAALIYGTRPGTSNAGLWCWREGFGIDLVANASGSRDAFGYGFVRAGASVFTVLSQGGLLRAMSRDGRERFTANLRSPHAVHAHSFVTLPNDRVAIVGFFFADYCDVAVTVDLKTLMEDKDAVQNAIVTKAPVWDRAVDLAMGPCEPDAAVIWRNPEDEEIPEDEEDLDDLGDVGDFTGLYVRDLDTGALVERHPYSGRPRGGELIAATIDRIAVQVNGGIDVIHRKTGAIREIPSAILDAYGMRVALVRNGRRGVEILPLHSV